MTEFCIVIPVFNPESRFVDLLRSLRTMCRCRILVVNDGSRRECSGIFEQISEMENITVLNHSVNRGKGRALKTAFRFVLDHWPCTAGVVTADSDGQHRPEDIAACVEALKENPESLILGCRNLTEKSIPWKSRIGNRLMILLFHWLTGRRFSDTQTGLRGIPASFLPRFLICPGERFEYETEMLLEAVKSVPPTAVREIPISTVYELNGQKTHFRPFADSLRIGRTLFCFRRRI